MRAIVEYCRWRRRRSEILKTLPALTRDRLLEKLAVEYSNPVLEAILTVLRGLQELAAENAGVVDQPDAQLRHYAAQMAAHEEAQQRILDLVKQAQEARDRAGRGGK